MRTAGRPKLPTRIQVTIKIELETKNRLIAAAKRRKTEGRIEIGHIVDWLATKYL